MIAHLMFFVGNKNVDWPAEGSAADDMYWRYAVARLGAYSSVVLDVSKEAGSANSKRSVEYFVGRMRLMRAMNAHRRLLTAHSGFDWTNRCDEAPELCDVTSAQVHFPNDGDDAIAQIEHKYYPFLVDAAARASAPYINVEFFYQWGPSDGCHFACCGTCTNHSSAPDPRGNLDKMRKVMWDNYFAGITGACWYHNDLGWDILDPRALTTTASEMATLRTLRDFWESVDRRAFVPVNASGVCVRHVQPADAVIQCLLEGDATAPLAMILRVRRETTIRPTLELAMTPREGFWLNPGSTEGARVPFVASSTAQQPASFAQDAVLSLLF